RPDAFHEMAMRSPVRTEEAGVSTVTTSFALGRSAERCVTSHVVPRSLAGVAAEAVAAVTSESADAVRGKVSRRGIRPCTRDGSMNMVISSVDRMLTAVHRRREPAVAQAGSNRQRQSGTALLGKFEQPGQEWGMRRDIRPVAIALVLAALATSVRAQSSQPVLDLAPGGFSETLLEPGIKGRDVLVDPLRMLVGWHRGSAAGPFRIDQVRALLTLARTPGDESVRD